ncbi:MAG: type II secretion system protein [wastewater metagenome]|nr:type II secretion system protein [Candidatus Loosdrechtia aerotolerans]
MTIPISKRKLYPLWHGRKKRTGNQDREAQANLYNGFTILEIMVALAITGISISIFFSLIGNSSRLRGRIDEHTKQVLLARNKTEEAFLGILEKNYIIGDEKRLYEGKTKDGIQWKVTENSNNNDEEIKVDTGFMLLKDKKGDNTKLSLPKGVILLNTEVGVINIDTVFFTGESTDELSDPDSEGLTEDEKTDRTSIVDDDDLE